MLLLDRLTKVLLVALLCVLYFITIPAGSGSGEGIPVAILGDSDSHSYRDSIDNKKRGGDYHHVTFNWPALWHRFRSHEVSLGIFNTWGSSYRIARVKHFLGLPARSPVKMDFEHNYAVSGLKCDSLLDNWPYQAKWFIDAIKRYPAFWQDGLVIIRIGVNDLGTTALLTKWGETGLDDMSKGIVDQCVERIETATRAILAAHAGVRIGILGMCRACNLTDTVTFWPQLRHIEKRDAVMGYYDQRIEALAESDDRVLFIDDVQWLKARWGDRYSETMKFETTLNNNTLIRSTSGDHPTNLILKDLHAGTVYNGFWLNNLVTQLNAGFNLNLTQITDKELYSVIEPAL